MRTGERRRDYNIVGPVGAWAAEDEDNVTRYNPFSPAEAIGWVVWSSGERIDYLPHSEKLVTMSYFSGLSVSAARSAIIIIGVALHVSLCPRRGIAGQGRKGEGWTVFFN